MPPRSSREVRPPAPNSHGRRLTLSDREEIACLLAAGKNQAEVATAIGFTEATISRELARNTISGRPSGWAGGGYRASTAQATADQRARRPGLVKLAVNTRLRDEVERRLGNNESPEQIAHRAGHAQAPRPDPGPRRTGR
jgi:IS30 family transposase